MMFNYMFMMETFLGNCRFISQSNSDFNFNELILQLSKYTYLRNLDRSILVLILTNELFIKTITSTQATQVITPCVADATNKNSSFQMLNYILSPNTCSKLKTATLYYIEINL